MKGQWGIWENQTDCTPYRSHPKTKRMRQMQWRLSCLPQSIEDAESAEEIDQYLYDLRMFG